MPAFFGGYGSGKTRAGAEKALRKALANPGVDGLIVSPTSRMLARTSLRTFLQICPRELITGQHKQEGWIELLGHTRIFYGSADKPGSLEGPTVGWFWEDESRLIKAEAHRIVLGRLRDKRAPNPQGWLTTTPAMGWLEDEFGTGRPGREAFHGSTIENACNLDPGYIDDLRRSYSPRLAKSLIDGQFSVLSGQVYEEFDDAVHVVEWRYDPALPLWLSWDFGVRAASILFAQEIGDFGGKAADGRRLPPRSLVVFDELQTEELPTMHQIPLVQARLAEFGRQARLPGPAPVWQLVCDPAGAGRDQATGMKSVDMLRAAFPTEGGRELVRYETALQERHIPTRIARVSGALKPVEGEATLYIARSLVRPDADTRAGQVAARRGIVKSLRGSTYPEKAGRRTSDRPLENEMEHARDCIEYLVVRAQNDNRRESMSPTKLVPRRRA